MASVWSLVLLCLVTPLRAAVVDYIFPQRGSLNGGSRITIRGSGFSNDQFNFGPGRENLGNVVKMVSATKSYDCDKHMDGNTQVQVTCYTRPMVEDVYTIQVTVDGVPLDPSAYCPSDPTKCVFTASSGDTPTITGLSRLSGPPGQLITAYGRIMTRMYEANDLSKNATNGVLQKIERVYMGGMPCNMLKADGSLYGLMLDEPTSKYGNMTCLITSKFIGAMRFTFLIEDFGRSDPSLNLLKLFPGDVIAMYEQYPQITAISPTAGSTEGYTYLTITGAGLDDNTVHPPIFKVAGVDCVDVLNVSDTSAVCVTPKQVTGSHFVGNRGLTVHKWESTQTNTVLDDIPTMSTSTSSYLEEHLEDGTFVVTGGTVGYVAGYFVPTTNGSFYIELRGDGSCRCTGKLSTTLDPADATTIFTGCQSRSTVQNLTAGQPYYIQVLFSAEDVSNATEFQFQLAVFSFNAPYNSPTHWGAQNEVQNVVITSATTKELQTIDFTNLPAPRTGVNEVQQITVTSADTTLHFRLKLHGVATGLLSVIISAADLQTAINSMPCIAEDAPVTVTQSANTYEVTFSGELGNWPEFLPVDVDPGVTVTVTEVTTGQSSYDKLIFQHDDLISPPVARDDTQELMAASLNTLFSVRCPDLKSYSLLYNDYEDVRPAWIPSEYDGTYVTMSEPFCGMRAFKNPTRIFYAKVTDKKRHVRFSTTSYKWICFAYKGIFENRVQLSYIRYYTLPGRSSVLTSRHFYDLRDFNFVNDGEKWNYKCVNALEALQIRHGDTSSIFMMTWIAVFKHKLTKEDIFIDDFMITEKVPTDVEDIINQRAVPAVRARILEVTKTNTALNVTLDPWECVNVNAISVRDAPTGTVTVDEVTKSSAPVTGFVKLTRNGYNFEFPPNATESLVAGILEATDASLGKMKVTKSGTCHGFTYRLEWLTAPGKQEVFVLDKTGLVGPGVDASVTEVLPGGVWHVPVPGHMLRTYHTVPQVTVVVNYLPAACDAPSCDYTWSSDLMPSVTDIQPTTGTKGTALQVTGSGFDAVNIENNVVRLGTSSTPCIVSSATDTSFTCTLGIGASDIYSTVVLVRGKGAAQMSSPVDFVYTTSVESYSPIISGLGGGLNMTITGSGLSNDTLAVEVDGRTCPTLFSNVSMIVCQIPPATTAGSVDVVVKEAGSVIATLPTQFTYDASLTPVATDTTPTAGSPKGGELLTIKGSQFGSDPVPIAYLTNTLDGVSVTAKLKAWHDSQVIISLPGLRHGTYDVKVNIPGRGTIRYSDGTIPQITSTFEVTDLTPRETSAFGGRLFTITGTGFTDDVDVKLGETTCSKKALTGTEITCQLEQVSHDHVITNLGEDLGYNWDQPNILIDVGDTVTWVWQSEVAVPPLYNIVQVSSLIDDTPVVNGFNSGNRTDKGVFRQEFVKEGTYYYTSGQIFAVRPDIRPRGQVVVQARPASLGTFRVAVNEVEARYSLTSGRRRRAVASCDSSYNSLCTVSVSANAVQPEIVLNPCLTQTVTSITPTEGTADTVITIVGVGFGTDPDCVAVTVGQTALVVVSLSDTEILAKVNVTDSPALYQPLPIGVELLGKGLVAYAMTEAERSFVYKPHIAGIQPRSGSVAGHALLTISGGGFADDASVEIDGVQCTVVGEVTPTEIVCSTPDRTAEVVDLPVAVRVGVYPAEPCLDPTLCTFSYLESVTPQLLSVSPTSVPSPTTSALTTLTITGAKFGTAADPSLITVEIGSERCAVLATDLSDTTVLCTIANLPVGTSLNNVLVNVSPYGVNRATDGVLVTGEMLISSVVPSEGSVVGGTELTVTGNGFFDDTVVTIDGLVCPVVDVSLARVVCVTPAHAAGTVDAVVTSLGQTYAAVSYTYSVAATPTIASISPVSTYEAGTVVTIAGTGFSTTPTENDVTIGGVACASSSATDTEITCAVGGNAAGSYPVYVNVAGKGIAQHPDTGNVTFTYDIAISAISPIEGSYGGGQLVTITGNGLSEAASVTICGMLCTVQNSNLTQFVCSTPSHDGLGSGDTACDVLATYGIVTTPALSAAFTYKDTLTPFVSSISPTRGGTGGGTLVTVTGSNFGTDPAMIVAAVDDVACTVISVVDTQVVCRTGAHAGNVKAPVSITRLDYGQAIYNAANFYYIDVWSSKYTWGGIQTPEEGDFIIVPRGMTLLLDVTTPIIKMLLIQGGKLMFEDKGSTRITLNVENILITDGGVLEIGTEEEPYLGEAEIVLHGHLRAKELPIFGAKTLAVRNGSLELHGRPIPSTWTVLAQTADVGATQVVLQAEPINWRVGDYMVIASTGDHMSQNENEKVQITAISGSTITFDPPLKFKHLGITETYTSPRRVTNLELRAEVGLLTRNILIRGSSNKDWEGVIEACDQRFDPGEFATQTCFQGRFGEEAGSDQFGAAVMFHQPVHSSYEVHSHMEYVEITYAGQAFRLGRYPIHFHRNGDMKGSYVRGCAIHWAFNRAINIHDTHYVLIEHNVVYDVMGGALFLEDSIEHDTVFQYNLVMFVKASSSLLNDDITPAGFWITHPANIVRHNHVVGGTHFGFWYRMHEHPIGPSYDPDICPRKVPLGEFYNNTVHSVGWYGLWVFEFYEPMEEIDSVPLCQRTVSKPAIFRNLTTWNSLRGAEWVECGAMQFHGFVVANNYKAGMEMYYVHEYVPKYSVDGSMIKDAVIIGHLNYAEHPVCTWRGLVMPFSNGLTVDGVEFFNFPVGLSHDETPCAALGTVKIICICSTYCAGYEYRFKNIYWDDTAAWKANFEWQNQAEFADLDGTLTGAGPNSRALAQTGVLPSGCQVDDGWSVNKPGVICPGSTAVDIVRFTFNRPSPESLLFKTVTFTVVDENGLLTNDTVTVPWRLKSSTHPQGWLALLPVNTTYRMSFDGMERVTNLSYTGTYWGLKEYTWLRITHASIFNSPFDKIGVLETVDPSNTVLLSRTPEYGDENGAVQVVQTETDISLTYLISGQDSGSYADDSIAFSAMKCFFPGCVDPGGSENELTDDRPADYRVWSDVKTWNYDSVVWQAQQVIDGTAGAVPPTDGTAEVFIPRGAWVVVDAVPVIEVKCLTIEGVLEFEYQQQSDGTYLSHTLKADYIIIRGGYLAAGYGNKIYQGQLEIILTGTLLTPTRSLDQGPFIGAKAMGVFGGLELHGIAHAVSWTRLRQTAESGSNTLYLVESVDWSAGDEIVVATTGFSPWETETHVIQSVGGAQNDEITLTAPLTYTHLGETDTLDSYPEVSYDIRAEVGLLSRNIKIMGAEDSTYDDEGYGARVLVSRELDMRDELDIRSNVGYANLSEVEFLRTGQDGFVEVTDPRFSIAFVNLGDVEKSRITSCSFVRGFSPAVGAFDTNYLVVKNNVFYHAVGQAIRDYGAGNRWLDNLITLTLWPGTFRGRYEVNSMNYEAAIEINKATSPIIQGNVVAGVERCGYRIDGEHCSDDTTPPEDRWQNNTVHAAMFGVYMLFDEDDCFPSEGCSLVSNFIIYKAFSYGFYSQVTCSVQLANVSFYDNAVSMHAIIVGPPAPEHAYADKFVRISDGLFIGQSPSFDCDRDKMLPADEKNLYAGSEAATWRGHRILDSRRRFGKMAIGWPFFLSEDNMVPEPSKAFNFAKFEPAMYGKITIEGSYFGRFGIACDGEYDLIISTNPRNPDVEQKIEISNVKVDSSVDENSLIIMEPPNVAYASVDECVDMDCDAKKICFVVDKDGSFMGSPGTIIPDASYEWNGDKTHGLGDYRIPSVLMTNMDGSKREISDVYDAYGITGYKNCQWNDYWNAYKCGTNPPYNRLLVENMDADFMTRRLSPVALRCSNDGLRYLDLYSGPRSVGICFGYACTDRLGLFYLLAPMNTDCDLYFTGTTPQYLRLHFLADADQWLLFTMYMGQQYRYDVFYNDTQVQPLNFDVANNKFLRPPATNPSYYVPTSAGQPGDNYFDIDEHTLTVLLKGPGIVKIKMTPQIIMSTTLELMTEEDFFASDKIISNLANFLQIAPENILIMNVVSENGRRRRRRGTGIVCTFMIGNPVLPSATATTISTDVLISLANKLILAGQTRSMSNVLGTQVGDFFIYRPAPPVSDIEAWNEYRENVDSGQFLLPVYTPDKMNFVTSLSEGISYEGAPFATPPRFQIVDDQNRLVPVLVAPDGNPWLVEATLDTSDEFANKDAVLIGNTTVAVRNGYAEFSNLGISHAGNNYRITFSVVHPADVGAGYQHVAAVPYVPKRSMYIETRYLNGSQLWEGETFDMEIYIKDSSTNLIVPDLKWKGEDWTGRVYVNEIIDQDARLSGTTDMTFSDEGYYRLSGLTLYGSTGKVALSVIARSTSASYVIVYTSVVDLIDDNHIPMTAYSKPVEIKFAENFDVIANNEALFLVAVYRWMKRSTENVEFYNMTAKEGSIVVDFSLNGDPSDVDAALQNIADQIRSEASVRFGDTEIYLSPYMKVDGQYFQNLDGQTGLTKAGIIALSCIFVLVVIVVVIVVVVIYLKKHKHRLLKEQDESTVELRSRGLMYESEKSELGIGHYADNGGFGKDIDSRPPSSGYASSHSSLSGDEKPKPRRRRSLTNTAKDKKRKEAMTDKLLASLAVPLTGDVSRPVSRSSVVSRQEIRTMFAPRMSVDEGPGPDKIASVD